MKSLYQFIIKPIGERYKNKINIDGCELIVNSTISSHKFVNREAEVVSVPLIYNTKIKKGDKVIVHHNLFRRYYNMKGKSVNSTKYFKDDLYFAVPSQVYMYYQKNKWIPNENYCFVKPLLEDEKIIKNKGILKYGNSSLEVLKINPGDIIGFKPLREFEFIIDNELLYCMESNDIVIKYEHKTNQEEYNPSWAKSS
jgi:hypothetical protein|tara:strand:- start:2352 stop:2942 length:591 start_codon:yes stop_codon:yes gene_type:complete